MRHPVHIATVATLGAIMVGAGAHDLRADDIADLKAQIRELDQKLRILERKQDIDREAAVEKAKSAPILTAGASGFSLQSANSNFVLKFKGLIQADARLYPDDHAARTGRDGFLIRRARPILEATMYEKYDFRMMLDFGSGLTSSASNIGFLQEGYMNARFTPQFQVQVGKFKEPVGLERLQSDSTLSFIERGYPTQLVPNRDAGIQIHGDVFNNTLNYAIGAFNGVADGGSIDTETLDDEKDIAARLFATPFANTKIDALRGLGVGIAGTYGNQSGTLANFVTAGQQKFFGYRTGSGANPANANVVADGDHWRLAPQANYYWGPLGLFAEYTISDQVVRRDAGTSSFPRVRNTAWQVAGSYVLTGEDASFKGVIARNPFSVANHTWGAVELVARYGQLDIDNRAFGTLADPATSASKASSWGAGVNWYLNRNVRLSLDYEQTDFTGGTSTFLKSGEKVILSRAQFVF